MTQDGICVADELRVRESASLLVVGRHQYAEHVIPGSACTTLPGYFLPDFALHNLGGSQHSRKGEPGNAVRKHHGSHRASVFEQRRDRAKESPESLRVLDPKHEPD